MFKIVKAPTVVAAMVAVVFLPIIIPTQPELICFVAVLGWGVAILNF